MIQHIGDPSLIPKFIALQKDIGGQPIVLIAEDADEALVTRDGQNETVVSTLLNITAGILGELLNIRMTNRPLKDVDKAVKRKGRLACHIQLEPLSPEHANRVRVRVRLNPSVPPLCDPTLLTDVYAHSINPDSHP